MPRFGWASMSTMSRPSATRAAARVPDPVRAALHGDRCRRRRHHRASARGPPPYPRRRHAPAQGRDRASRSISRWRRPRRCSTSRLSTGRTPAASCRRSATERTTEGGLDVISGFTALKAIRRRARAGGHPGFDVHRALARSAEGERRTRRRRSSSCTPAPGATPWRAATPPRPTTNSAACSVAAAQTADARARMPRRPRPRLRHRARHRRPAADRRAQHRPFPHRRGDFRRPCRGGDERCAPAMAEGRASAGRHGDHRDRQRPLRHPPHRARRWTRFGERFIDRCFTEIEQRRSDRRAERAASYAKRFAAKEACAKALGTGLQRGVFWRDMGVVNLPSGQPTMRLTGGAAERLKAIMPPGTEPFIHLTHHRRARLRPGVRGHRGARRPPAGRSPLRPTPEEISIPSRCTILHATQ